MATLTLTRPQQLVAARELRRSALPAGFEHENGRCPKIGDLAPEFAKYLTCYRTLATISGGNVDAASVARLVAPLHLLLDAKFTSCGPLDTGSYGDATECTSIGAMHQIPVVVDVLLGSPTSATVRWTHVKLEVEPSLNLNCPTGASTCIVGAP